MWPHKNDLVDKQTRGLNSQMLKCWRYFSSFLILRPSVFVAVIVRGEVISAGVSMWGEKQTLPSFPLQWSALCAQTCSDSWESQTVVKASLHQLPFHLSFILHFLSPPSCTITVRLYVLFVCHYLPIRLFRLLFLNIFSLFTSRLSLSSVSLHLSLSIPFSLSL